jgi:hypothetical protein
MRHDPRAAHDGDTRRDDERSSGDVEVTDGVRHRRIEIGARHSGPRTDAEFEAALDGIRHGERDPVADERDSDECHRRRSVPGA